MSVSSSPFISNSPYGSNFTPVKIGTRSNTVNESKSASKISKPSHQEKHQNSAGGGSRYNRKKNQNEGKVVMQIEEEEDLDDYSIKHVAAARYLRNHRLINEIFGDTVVPDVRNVVSTQRLTILKKQVQSLTIHQKKLEAEIADIEKRFMEKKRKFVEGSEWFQSEMKKMCSTKPVDSAKYQQMVEDAIEKLKMEQQKQLEEIKRQEEARRQEEVRRQEEMRRQEELRQQEAKQLEEAKQFEEVKRLEEAKRLEEIKRLEEAKQLEQQTISTESDKASTVQTEEIVEKIQESSVEIKKPIVVEEVTNNETENKVDVSMKSPIESKTLTTDATDKISTTAGEQSSKEIPSSESLTKSEETNKNESNSDDVSSDQLSQSMETKMEVDDVVEEKSTTELQTKDEVATNQTTVESSDTTVESKETVTN